jgi:hypothetical protein
VVLATSRLIALAGLAVVLLLGCGGSTSPATPTKAGIETVTFHVKDMGKRLALM